MGYACGCGGIDVTGADAPEVTQKAMVISKEPLTYSLSKDGPLYPYSKALFDFAFERYKQLHRLTSDNDVPVMEIYRHAGYSGSFSRHWRNGKENFSNINKMFQLAEFLEVDPLICMEILQGKLSVADAIVLSGKRDGLREHRKEREKRPLADERVVMSFSDRLRVKIMRVLAGNQLGDEDHFDTREVAELFKVSQRTVQWWIDTDKLRCAKTSGGHSRVSYQNILDFIHERGVYNPLTMFINRKVLVFDTPSSVKKIEAAFKDFRAMDIFEAREGDAGIIQLGLMKPEYVVLGERRGIDKVNLAEAIAETEGYEPLLLIAVGSPTEAPRLHAAGIEAVLPSLTPEALRSAIVDAEREHLSRPRRLRGTKQFAE